MNSALQGRYRIERQLGEGGMATVYLAEDLRHRRRVALKVLRPELGAVLGPERFLAEIGVTANLQHPHVLPLFDSGDADGLLFYVMPFVEGESLRDRLERETQLPVEEALRITTAVAAALDYAHARGVIHRDLKPENVLLQAGEPVVADFGIALAITKAGGARITQTGLSLGTPQYMSPEQAAGDRPLDGRSDVYSLGVVLYEMLTGQPPHAAPTVQAVVARVLTDTPRPVRELRSAVPEHVDAALERALTKLPADRWEGARQFADALEGRIHVGRVVASPATRAPTRLRRGALPWAIAVAACVVAFLLAGIRGTPPRPGPFVANLLAPPGFTFRTGPLFAVSPDGAQLVFVAGDAAGRSQLFVRRLDEPEARPLPGTEGAENPFWSADGRSLGFFADGRLKVVDAAGTSLRTLCPAHGFGPGSWSDDGVILFDDDGIWQVPAAGGACAPVLRGNGEWLAAVRPSFLPDGRHFLFNAAESPRLFIGDLATGEYSLLAPDREQGIFAPPGYVLFHHEDGGLYAQRFDPRRRRFQGEPWRVLEREAYTWARGSYSASATGVLVADVPPAGVKATVVARTRGGSVSDPVEVPTLRSRPESSSLFTFRLSRDGRRASVDGGALGIYDFARGVWERQSFTADPRQATINHTWSPGDSLIAVAHTLEHYSINVLDLRDGSTKYLFGPRIGFPELRPLDWSPDGRHLIYWHNAPGNPNQLGLYDFSDGSTRPLYPLVGTPRDARFSPDGRWVAYDLLEGLSSDVHVRPFPGPGVAVRISPASGASPRWHPDGTGIYYLTADGGIASVDVELTASRIEPGPPQTFLHAPPPGQRIRSFEPFPDGSGLALLLVDATPPTLTVVTDWLAHSGAASRPR